MRLYVAGPMTGLPEFNYPAFNTAEMVLRRMGYDVVNPARPYDVEPTTWQGYMVRALADVASCEGICLLDGWQQSRGAKLEVTVALALDLEIREYEKWRAERAA